MAAEPYTDVATHVRDELRRAWLRLEYQIRLGWREGASGDRSADDVVGPEDMGRLFAAARGAAPPADEAGATQVLEQWLALHEQTEARIRATIDARDPLAAGRADPRVRADAAPVVDADVRAAARGRSEPRAGYRYLARDPSCRGLDGRLLAQLVYDTPQTRSLMARDLSPTLAAAALPAARRSAAPDDSLMFRQDPRGDAARLPARRRSRSSSIPSSPRSPSCARARSAARSRRSRSSARRRRCARTRSCSRCRASAASARSCCSSSPPRTGTSALLRDRLQAPRAAAARRAAARSCARSCASCKLLDAVPAFVDIDDARVTDERPRRDARRSSTCSSTSGTGRSRSRSIASACRASTSARSST